MTPEEPLFLFEDLAPVAQVLMSLQLTNTRHPPTSFPCPNPRPIPCMMTHSRTRSSGKLGALVGPQRRCSRLFSCGFSIRRAPNKPTGSDVQLFINRGMRILGCQNGPREYSLMIWATCEGRAQLTAPDFNNNSSILLNPWNTVNVNQTPSHKAQVAPI